MDEKGRNTEALLLEDGVARIVMVLGEVVIGVWGCYGV